MRKEALSTVLTLLAMLMIMVSRYMNSNPSKDLIFYMAIIIASACVAILYKIIKTTK